MDICLVNDSFKMGGVERVVIELANSFQENNNNVTLIDFSGDYKFYYNVNDEINRPDIIKPRIIKRKMIGKILKLKCQVTKQKINVYDFFREQARDLIEYLKINNHDILILCQGILTALIPLIKKEIPNIKIIAWQHNEYDIYINNYYKEIITDYLMGINKADLVVCLTEEDSKKFRKLNNNTCYIYNPLTISYNKQRVSNLNNNNIIFVGRLNIEQKGLDYLIEIGEKLKNGWRILVAGDGPDKQILVKMIRKKNLEDKVILKGSLKSEELVELYSSGSIFISTSRWEGFGLVITEAMAFGLPVISFNNHGPQEILKDGEFGVLIERNNLKDFLCRLSELIDDSGKREFYQKKSLERVKDFRKEIIFNEWNSKLKCL